MQPWEGPVGVSSHHGGQEAEEGGENGARYSPRAHPD